MPAASAKVESLTDVAASKSLKQLPRNPVISKAASEGNELSFTELLYCCTQVFEA
jgi:hypothetical protein